MRTRGLTLLETLLALSLGTLLAWSGLRAYSLSLTALRHAGEQLLRVEEARLVLWRLADERRAHGFAGCARLPGAAALGLAWRYGSGGYPMRRVHGESYRLASVDVAVPADAEPAGTATLLLSSCRRVDTVIAGRLLTVTAIDAGWRLEFPPGARPALGAGGHDLGSLEVNRLETPAYHVDAARRQLRDAADHVVLDHVAALTEEAVAPGLIRLRMRLDDGTSLALDVALLNRAP